MATPPRATAAHELVLCRMRTPGRPARPAVTLCRRQLLLKILALEPMNGYAVSQRLKQVSNDVLQVSDGSLYPALHKLEQEGWITAEWKTSEYGRRAKYYSLTRPGRRHLEEEADNWGRLSSAISRVVKLKEA